MVDNQNNEFNPNYIIPPGDTIQELLDHYDMSQVELAERTGRSAKNINEIIKGKAPITQETAIEFESVFGVSAEFWNNLESNYRHLLAKKKHEDDLNDDISHLKQFPLKFMIQNNWIKECSNKTLQLQEVLNFFGVASFEAWKNVWKETFSQPDAAFRQSEAFPANAESVAAWLRKGEIEALQKQYPPYNEKLFKETLKEIRKLTDEDPALFLPKLTDLCGKAGVVFLLIPDPPKSRVSGAATWVGKKPIIQLCFRHGTNDHFWFSFFHEAAHILKHSKKTTFLEYSDNRDQLEEEANAFAAQTLIPQRSYSNFTAKEDFSESAIIDFSHKVGISPGCVLGRLQRDGYVKYPTKLNKLKKSYKWN
ncbi:HigA family addiction module antitoxin [Bacillus massiliglaciei]|uniref:HigA family addiction module antitoxin n=1 Tax=Bacillus massiliglaciei TaxID=1816693 RepID=UPI000AA35140|nr:HigA family addiction module antitoxin [Bacillus massiliglaciei]